MSEAQPVDDRRLAKLQMASLLILDRADSHTPLERRWAQEVLDLTVALREARDTADRSGRSGTARG